VCAPTNPFKRLQLVRPSYSVTAGFDRMDLRVGTAGFARSSSRESQKKTLASPGNWATLGYASSMTGQLADSRMSPPTVAVLFASVDILKHRKQIGMPIGNQSLRNPYKASIISRIFTEANNLLHILLSVVLLLPPGLPSRTIVRTVSSEQPGFFFNFPLFSPVLVPWVTVGLSFLFVSFWEHVNIPSGIAS